MITLKSHIKPFAMTAAGGACRGTSCAPQAPLMLKPQLWAALAVRGLIHCNKPANLINAMNKLLVGAPPKRAIYLLVLSTSQKGFNNTR